MASLRDFRPTEMPFNASHSVEPVRSGTSWTTELAFVGATNVLSTIKSHPSRLNRASLTLFV